MRLKGCVQTHTDVGKRNCGRNLRKCQKENLKTAIGTATGSELQISGKL